jgi:predicted glycoside hydrolase/deacetylase ChbG (UPF0249 family)
MAERTLVVNADDFGLSEGTNAGIARAHQHGIVTSASLMVDAAAALDAAEYALARSELSVGLHLDLGEWLYVGEEWIVRYERGPADAEIPRQLELFRELLGRDPTHLDSHQHVHREEPAASLMKAIAADLGTPLRGAGTVRYCGDFYGQLGTGDPLPDAIMPRALVRLIEELPAGVTELACHPGLDLQLDSPYRAERAREVETLCDPAVREALEREGVRLVPFATLR